MKQIPISVFRTNCHAILARVRKTVVPIRVMRRGKPVAEIVPASREKRPPRRLGSMAGTARIVGDIVGPTGSLDDWGGDVENVFSSKT